MEQRDVWNPLVYDQFVHERQQPFFDLLQLIQPGEDFRIVDLGCGTGELTRRLHEHLGAGQALGVDKSQGMLAASKRFVGDGLTFEAGDIGNDDLVNVVRTRLGGRVDLVFSHAALQWVNDHVRTIRRWSAALTTRGQLAVQIPANDDHITHMTARSVARRAPYQRLLDGAHESFDIQPIDQYASLLNELGFTEQHVRLQVYGHRLANREAKVTWVRGTLLTRYQSRLPADLWPRFLDEYRSELFKSVNGEGEIFYPFKRVLMWGRKR